MAAVTPGPSNVMLTASGAHAGIMRGLPCLLGVVTGMAAMMFVVPLGLGSLVLDHPRILNALRVIGAAFILWLSWKIATSPSRPESEPDGRSVGYVDAAVLQWINPKSWVVATSAAGTFLTTDAGGAIVQAAALAVLFGIAALPCGFVWLAFGAAVQHSLRNGRRRRIFNVALGALLAVSILAIVR